MPESSRTPGGDVLKPGHGVDIVISLSHRHARQLARIDARLDAQGRRLEQLDNRFRSVDARFDLVDRQFDRFDDRLAQVAQRLDFISTQLAALARRRVS
jgi:septal ring factor EnvC (AmiA/AmiB activator)